MSHLTITTLPDSAILRAIFCCSKICSKYALRTGGFMLGMKRLIGLFCVAISVHVSAEPTTAIVDQLQAQRQEFAQDDKIDPQRLSHEIQAALKDSVALDRAGNDPEAIARLSVLEKYAPLTRFPSYDVQTLCAGLYAKLNQPNDAEACRARAAAMAEILQKHSGSGATPDDPVRVITIEEVSEWIHAQSAQLSNVRAYPYHDANLQAITYAGPATGNQSTVAYFLFSPRLLASLNSAKINVFDPLPINPQNSRYQAALNDAHAQRLKFLTDTSFDYPALIQLCASSEREAMRLQQQGDVAGALSKIREIEKIRPIQDVPIFDVISTYSFLLGKSGDIDAQSRMRLYLFGIAQDIAHSGNGLTPESAIHVAAISEEYAWMHEKGWRAVKQSLITKGNAHYDAIEATDGSGHSQTAYFEVSQIYAREMPTAAQ
ncbi:hypothetical protein [Paraburkholderia antibiotica]|uniref:DUF4919 domain-containing protein n=1 Tax=Paraburkholderia antibiotica TaxID=2728839 RepID=A0A7X9ZZG2_9BURK|nr:hypothetical protein [Paraburkholderia antibiotica]NML32995.1 DUF4919 domain-containing protein [Paraburkholderia antibiotica]